MDLIERQAAIDVLGDEPEVWTDKDEYAQGLNNQWHYDRNAILSCPSAQPETEKRTSESAQNVLNDDLISRKAAIDGADEIIKRDTSGNNAVVEAMKAWKVYIGNLPSAQPERMRGKWIWKGEEGDSRFMCSVCKCKEYVPTCNGVPNIWEFCPNCGADMKGEHDALN